MSDVVEPYKTGVILCPVCKEAVQKGEWYILARQAVETMQTGSPNSSYNGVYVPQWPVHLNCVRST